MDAIVWKTAILVLAALLFFYLAYRFLKFVGRVLLFLTAALLAVLGIYLARLPDRPDPAAAGIEAETGVGHGSVRPERIEKNPRR